MDNLINKTLSVIDDRHLKPLPKWYFVVKLYLKWSVALISIMLAGLSVAMFYLEFDSLDYEILDSNNYGSLGWLTLIMPWAWLILCLALAFLGYLELRKGKFGYRWQRGRLLLILALVCLVTSLLVSINNWHRATSDALSDLSLYNEVFSPRAIVWQQPADCLLAGHIVNHQGNDLEIKDLKGKHWNLELTAETILPAKFKLDNGAMIKIICHAQDDSLIVEEIRPWHGSDKGQRKILKPRIINQTQTKAL